MIAPCQFLTSAHRYMILRRATAHEALARWAVTRSSDAKQGSGGAGSDNYGIIMAFLCVGGEHEGMTVDTDNVVHTFEPQAAWERRETYIKIARKGSPSFYMVSGMRPVDAIARYQELTAGKAPA